MIDKTDLSGIGKGVTLNGDALVGALTRRFHTSVEDATVDARTFSILRPANSDDLIREEDFVKDERLPYWADVWPSSIVLASKLMELKAPEVIVRKGEPIDRALKRLKSKLDAEGIMDEVRRLRAFETPTQKSKRKAKANAKRAKAK